MKLRTSITRNFCALYFCALFLYVPIIKVWFIVVNLMANEREAPAATAAVLAAGLAVKGVSLAFLVAVVALFLDLYFQTVNWSQ